MQKRSKTRPSRQPVRMLPPRARKQVWIGVDLGDRKSEVCVLDDRGEIVRRESVRTNPTAMREYFAQLAGAAVAIETGTHSPWVSRLLGECGLTVTVANPREVRKIYQSNRKNDRSDAENLARLLRLDPKLLAPIQHRSAAMQADLTTLKARDALVRARTTCINTTRGLVKSTGERLPQCSAEAFAHKVATLVPSALRSSLEPILATIAELTTKIRAYDKGIEALARQKYPQTALLDQVPSVGAVTSLAYILILVDPKRFTHSRDVGACLGFVPRQHDSGDQQPQLHITKAGNTYLRRLLVGSAHYILGPFGPDCQLRRFGLRLTARGGKNAKKRAVVAVARKLAVLLHHLWSTGEAYNPFHGLHQATPAA